MIERLEIKNFGPLVDINIELKPIMIFIGNQATGKSTISKLIALFRGWEFILNEAKFGDLIKHYNIFSYLRQESYIKFTSDAFVFELSNGKINLEKKKEHSFYKTKKQYNELSESQTNFNLELVSKELKNIKTELTETTPTPEREKELKQKEKELSLQLNHAELVNKSFSAYALEVFKLENYSEYIPSERIFVSIASGLFMNLQNSKVPLPGCLISFGAEFEKARLELKLLDVEFLNAKYKYENNEDRIYVGDDKFIPFKESASGFQTLIPMLLVIDYKTRIDQFRGLTFIVEEPELNLFPTAQKHLTRKLIEKCASYYYEEKKDFKNELVITTHSPYILSSLNNLLLAHRIATKKPECISKLEVIIPRKSWIDNINFSAYSLENGSVRDLLDKDTSLISESELDSASEEINNEFDLLMEIYRSKDK